MGIQRNFELCIELIKTIPRSIQAATKFVNVERELLMSKESSKEGSINVTLSSDPLKVTRIDPILDVVVWERLGLYFDT